MAIDTLSSSVGEESKNSPDAEILTAIAKRLNAKIVFLHAPFNRRLYLMKNGTIDLMAGLLKRPEREKYIHFVHPPYKERSDTIFFVPKGKASQILTYNDLYPLKIGTLLGSKYFYQFDEDNKLTKEPNPKGAFNFKKLLLGRLDTVIYAESTGIDLVHKMGIADQMEIAQFRFSKKKQVYIGISKHSRLMDNLDEIERTLGQMIACKEIQQIIIDYYTRRNLPVPAL